MSLHRRALALAALAILSLPALLPAQQTVTDPVAFFGHPIGAEYVLPNYEKLLAYWQRLDAESDRISVVEIGRTAEGRAQQGQSAWPGAPRGQSQPLRAGPRGHRFHGGGGRFWVESLSLV